MWIWRSLWTVPHISGLTKECSRYFKVTASFLLSHNLLGKIGSMHQIGTLHRHCLPYTLFLRTVRCRTQPDLLPYGHLHIACIRYNLASGHKHPRFDIALRSCLLISFTVHTFVSCVQFWRIKSFSSINCQTMPHLLSCVRIALICALPIAPRSACIPSPFSFPTLQPHYPGPPRKCAIGAWKCLFSVECSLCDLMWMSLLKELYSFRFTLQNFLYQMLRGLAYCHENRWVLLWRVFW